MLRRLLALIITLIISSNLSGQETTADGTDSEGFKNATVSDYLSGKYQWKAPDPDEETEIEVDTSTPMKSREQKDADYRARQDAHWKYIESKRREAEFKQDQDIDEDGIDTIDMDELEIEEEYSPLMRMSAMKDLNEIDPRSGNAYLADTYYTDFESEFLNRWHIPLIGSSQEALAKQRYEREQYERFVNEISGTLENLENLDSKLANELIGEFNETQYQRSSTREAEATPGSGSNVFRN